MTGEEMIDMFEEDAGAVNVDDSALGKISTLAQEQIKIEDEIAALEEKLSDKRKAHQRISFVDLPAAMNEAGMLEFVLSTGEKVCVKSGLKAGIAAGWPEEKRQQAFDFLRQNGAESLIKSELSAKFGKGEEEKAKELSEQLNSQDRPHTLSTSVQWNTLTAWVKERIADGKPVDHELLGIHEYEQTQITRKEN